MDPLLQRLREIDSTTLADAGKQLAVLDPALRPQRLGLKLAGRAVTVAAGDDLMPVLDGLARAGAGDVLVVDSGGSARAQAGELFASEALRRGLAGVVIDGRCRDTAELRRIELPFYARGCVPNASPAAAVPGAPGTVRCGGAAIAPGDLLLGDDDGIVTGPPDAVAAVLDAAEALQATERRILAAIRAGESLFEWLDYEEHLVRLRAGQESALQFRS
jgi:4-hydroxy-4-methyl-2-oxoglutarate aldolase